MVKRNKTTGSRSRHAGVKFCRESGADSLLREATADDAIAVFNNDNSTDVMLAHSSLHREEGVRGAAIPCSDPFPLLSPLGKYLESCWLAA